MGSSNGVEVGFAKLHGEDFEYYMQTYSIILGRNSKNSTVDVDLFSLGGGMNISRFHARIFYDFQLHRFALDVIGKNGCFVEGVLHLPGNPPVKLDSQDLLQIVDKKFYFLLPIRGIFGRTVQQPRHVLHPVPPLPSSAAHLPHSARTVPPPVQFGSQMDRAGPSIVNLDDEDDGGVVAATASKKLRRAGEGNEVFGYSQVGTGKAPLSNQLVPAEKKAEPSSMAGREADNEQLLQLEEEDVISSVAIMLSEYCRPGEYMPMVKLHAKLLQQYCGIWHHTRVRKYLKCEDWSVNVSKGRPWVGLMALLRKYPEHFVLTTRTKGNVIQELVSLESLFP